MKTNYRAVIYIEADNIEEAREIFDECNQSKISIDSIEETRNEFYKQ